MTSPTEPRPGRVVRFGAGTLELLEELAGELGLKRLLLVTTQRGSAVGAGLPVESVYDGVRSHVPIETVVEGALRARAAAADGLVALGGGSAIDTCKAMTVELLPDHEVRTIAVPTTYAGAEWTPFFGITLEPGRKSGGSEERARPIAAIYDPELQLDLPPVPTVGTAMNALAHCAEAYYAPGRSETSDADADKGARSIAEALPLVVAEPGSLDARSLLLEGAMHAAFALGDAGLGLAHAMAQALGGRYGLPHGAMNALCLPPALRFNEPAVPDAVARFGNAVGAVGPAAAVEALARLGGFERLRDFDIPEQELGLVGEAAAARPGARANPRPAGPPEVTALLREIW